MKRFIPAAILACVSLAAGDDPYEIRFDRPFAKGAKFSIESTVSRESDGDGNIGGLEGGKRTVSVELKGVVEIRKVDAKGRVAEATCKVGKCIVRDAPKNADAEPFPAGHMITIRSGGGKHEVDLGGKAVAEDTKELLPRLWPWAAGDDDSVFGTPDKKKVGESWTLDGAKVVERLAEITKLKMDPAKTTATGKLLGVIDVKGVKCLDVEIEVSIPDVEFAGHLAGFDPDETKLTARIRRALPVDAKRPLPRWTDSFDSDVPMKGTMAGYKGLTMRFMEGEKRELSLAPAK